MQFRRAQRKPREEWEKYREKLVKLYVHEGTLRKDIIDTMAKEHGFIITDKQLKHQFRKWGTKKYIPDADMNIMLSLRRKSHVEGKEVRFQYKGVDLEPQRIERADKRHKGPLLSPIDIPPYIKVYTLPGHNSGQAQNATLLNQPIGLEIPPLDSSTQFAELDWSGFDTGSNQTYLGSFTSNNWDHINGTNEPDIVSDLNILSPHLSEATGLVCDYNLSLAVLPQSLSPAEHLGERSVSEDDFCLSDFLDLSSVPDSPGRISIEPFPHEELNPGSLNTGSDSSNEEFTY